MTAFMLVLLVINFCLLAYESMSVGKQLRSQRLKLYNQKELLVSLQKQLKLADTKLIEAGLREQRAVDFIYKRINELELELAATKKALMKRKHK